MEIDDVRFDFQEAEITLNNNLMMKEPASQPIITDFCPDYRDVGGSVTFYAGEQELVRKVLSKTFNRVGAADVFREITSAVTIRLGGQFAGDPQLLITMPRVQFDRGALDLAQGALGTFSLPFMALAPPSLVAADNELQLTYGVAA